MISLKAAALALSAVGAVAAGGATWASVARPDAAPVSAHDKIPATVQKAGDAAAPAKTVRGCLPAEELKKRVGEPAQKGERAVKGGTAAAGEVQRRVPDAQDRIPGKDALPGTDRLAGKEQLPGADTLPAAGKPGYSIQTAPPEQGRVPVAEPGLPKTDLPVCPPAPGARTLPKTGAKAPAAPQPPLPSTAPQADCSKLAPAVPAGGTVERTVLLAKGLKHVSDTTAAKPLGAGQRLCTVTQKWVSRAGTATWITVERIVTPAQTSEERLRQALKLPEGAARTRTADGTVVWQAPAGRGGVLVFDRAGKALLVNGSPDLAPALRDLAQKIAAAPAAVR